MNIFKTQHQIVQMLDYRQCYDNQVLYFKLKQLYIMNTLFLLSFTFNKFIF